MTTNASRVPRPPTIANSGTSLPRTLRLSGARNGMSGSGLRSRSAITEACAIVNESIAPKP